MFQEILAVVVLFLTSETFAQNLEAILSETRLPVPVHGMPVVYDGENTIYVLGGNGPSNNYQKDILRFDVTTQTLEKVGTMDPLALGSAVWTGNENILYFGGYNGSERQGKVWSYKPDGGSYWTQAGDLPSDADETSSVWDQGEYSYVFEGSNGTGSYLNTISRYSSVNNTSIVVGELPSPRFGTSAVWDEATEEAYVFGGVGSGGLLVDIVKFNPENGTVVKLNVTLPVTTFLPCAIWTGTEAYIIGEGNSGMFRFNPSTNEVLSVSVNNLPGPIYGHGCAFVKKLNRIYVFGGLKDGSRRDWIMYIDLTTSTPQLRL